MHMRDLNAGYCEAASRGSHIGELAEASCCVRPTALPFSDLIRVEAVAPLSGREGDMLWA